MRETARTRALRRAMHDTYAPWPVRSALRSYPPQRDLFERIGTPLAIIVGLLVLVVFVRMVVSL